MSNNPNNTHTITLKHPITFGSETIEQLQFKTHIKAKNLRKVAQQQNFGDLLNIAAELCAQPPSVLDELEGEDIQTVTQYVGKLLQTGLEIGPSS